MPQLLSSVNCGSGINRSNSFNTSNAKLHGSMNSFMKAHSKIDKGFVETLFEISKRAATEEFVLKAPHKGLNLFVETRNLPNQLSLHKKWKNP